MRGFKFRVRNEPVIGSFAERKNQVTDFVFSVTEGGGRGRFNRAAYPSCNHLPGTRRRSHFKLSKPRLFCLTLILRFLMKPIPDLSLLMF